MFTILLRLSDWPYEKNKTVALGLQKWMNLYNRLKCVQWKDANKRERNSYVRHTLLQLISCDIHWADKDLDQFPYLNWFLFQNSIKFFWIFSFQFHGSEWKKKRSNIIYSFGVQIFWRQCIHINGKRREANIQKIYKLFVCNKRIKYD